jgi:KaiC/GvpD/RAD55 family RecA-like ATPase
MRRGLSRQVGAASDSVGEWSNVARLIGERISKCKGEWVFMLEVPEDKYIEVNIETVRALVNKMGYSGLYVSLNRPYPHLVSLFRRRGINTAKLRFVDAALCHAAGRGRETPECIYVSEGMSINELTKAVYKMLPRIKGRATFLFLDSITTLVLYQPLSEALRFTEFLSRAVARGEVNGVVVNVSSQFARKKFIRDIVLAVDGVIRVGSVGSLK